MPTVYACEFLVAFIWCLCKKYESFKRYKIPRHYFYVWYMYQYSYLLEQVEVLLSQFEWKSRDSPTETRLTGHYRSTDSLSFVTPANFPRTVTVRRMANDVTYTMYAVFPIHFYVYNLCSNPPYCCNTYSVHSLLCILYCTLSCCVRNGVIMIYWVLGMLVDTLARAFFPCFVLC